MTGPVQSIERMVPPLSDTDLRSLAQLLVDAVDSGASVSFLAPLTLERAEDWWRRTTAAASPRAVILVARDHEGIVGTVSLQPAWGSNQPHRAEVTKLLVHRRCQRRGLGTRLMLAIEAEARQGGFRLLTLDTSRGSPADRMYRAMGWTPAGVIPGFSLSTDGKTLHDAVFFYKALGQPEPPLLD